MSLIQINEEKCQKDGLCAAECPMTIIRQLDKDQIPIMVPGGEQICNACGHCMAVCPQGAIDHERVPFADCLPIIKDDTINQEQALQFLRSRRSTRRFKDRPVDADQISRLIEIARYAPSASNAQPVEWMVVNKKEDISRIAELTVDWMRTVQENPSLGSVGSYLPFIIAAWDAGVNTITWNAPVVIIASAPGESRNAMVDLTIALTYLELAARPMGLGTCWAGLAQAAMTDFQPLKEFVGLPESHISCYPMMLGVPKYRYHRMPERKAPPIKWKSA